MGHVVICVCIMVVHLSWTACGDNGMKELESKVADLESRVELMGQLVSYYAGAAIRRDAHIAHLLELLAVSQPNTTEECPRGSMRTETRTNPPHSLCIHIQPQLTDSTLLVDGHWQSCNEVRDWTLVLQIALKQVFPNWDTGFTFVDIGAHIGMCSVYLASLSGGTLLDTDSVPSPNDLLQISVPLPYILPQFEVIAVEPDPMHASMLRASARLNGVEGLIRVHQALAWSEKDLELEYRRFKFHHSAGSYVPSGDGNFVDSNFAPGIQQHEINLASSLGLDVKRVPTVTVDDIVQDAIRERKLMIMKIDVEGQEMHVLRGAQKAFDSNGVLLVHFEFGVTLRRDGVRGADVLRFLLSNRFQLFCPLECGETVPAYHQKTVTENEIDDFVSRQKDHAFDMVAVHDSLALGDEFSSVLESVANAFSVWKVSSPA